MNTITNACCDRCGMIYPKTDTRSAVIAGKHIDLCPECADRLERYMKMEEEKND